MTGTPTAPALILIAWFCVGQSATEMQQAIEREDLSTVRHMFSRKSPAKCFVAPAPIYGVRGKTVAEQIHRDTGNPYKVTFFEVMIVPSKKIVVTGTIERIPREA